MLPLVPVTVIVYGPGVTFEATVKVSVEVPAPVMDVGLKPTVTPDGWPDAAKPITELKPPTTLLVIVDPYGRCPAALRPLWRKERSQESPSRHSKAH